MKFSESDFDCVILQQLILTRLRKQKPINMSFSQRTSNIRRRQKANDVFITPLAYFFTLQILLPFILSVLKSWRENFKKNKNRFAFFHFFHFFYHYHFYNNNYYLFILFNFLLDLKKWLKNLTWCQVGSRNDSSKASRIRG